MTASALIVHCKSKNDDQDEHLAPEIITIGVLKKIFGILHCFGAILAVNMDKLPWCFLDREKELV